MAILDEHCDFCSKIYRLVIVHNSKECTLAHTRPVMNLAQVPYLYRNLGAGNGLKV